MFRRALRLGSRVSVASAAAVIPATAAACLSDSKPGVEIKVPAKEADPAENAVAVAVN